MDLRNGGSFPQQAGLSPIARGAEPRIDFDALRPYRYNDIVSHVTAKFNPQFARICKNFSDSFPAGFQSIPTSVFRQIGVNTYFSIMPSTTAWMVTAPPVPSSTDSSICFPFSRCRRYFSGSSHYTSSKKMSRIWLLRQRFLISRTSSYSAILVPPYTVSNSFSS